MSIKSELNNLKESDLWSLVLFVLCKLKEAPEYSSLSELAFILDKSNFLHLCEYFGGQTITIPTMDELEDLLYGLLLYYYVDVEMVTWEDAITTIGKTKSVPDIRKIYRKVKEVLTQYDIHPRGVQ